MHVCLALIVDDSVPGAERVAVLNNGRTGVREDHCQYSVDGGRVGRELGEGRGVVGVGVGVVGGPHGGWE